MKKMADPGDSSAGQGSPTLGGVEEEPLELIRDYPCTSCGAGLEFEPGTMTMECPFCGTENKIDIDLTEAEEHSLEELPLNPATTKKGMEVLRRSFKCDNCGAVQAVEPEAITAECAYCGSDAMLEMASSPDIVRPSSLVPFTFDVDAARGKFSRWLGSWWRRLVSPGALRDGAIVTKINGIYAPFFTFDAQAESDWSGFRGDYYYVTVGSGKNRRTVRKTRWTYRSGHHSHFYDDILEYASQGLPEATLEKAMPFDTRKLVPFSGEFLAGFSAEEYTLDPKALWQSARDTMMGEEWRACRRALGGDTYRNLKVHTTLLKPTWKHVLLPLYMANYVYGQRHFHFMVNGQTGEVQGTAPISWIKVGAIVGAVVAAVVLIAGLLGAF